MIAADHQEVPVAVVDLFVCDNCSLRTVHAKLELDAPVNKGQTEEVTDTTIIKVEEQPSRDVGLELEAEFAPSAGIPAEVAGPLVGDAHELQTQTETQQGAQQQTHLQGEVDGVESEAHCFKNLLFPRRKTKATLLGGECQQSTPNVKSNGKRRRAQRVREREGE